ncbi:MAG: hypothetical protein IT384_30200 [Deltaproteobacteria bacterium]|nr:hypothetical protein [Deltaproteobacteria bacterium]
MGTVRAIFLTFFSSTLAASLLVACAGVSAVGGLVGAGLSLAGVLVIFLLTAGTQSGCSANVCLSVVEPCLTDAGPGRFDVCLSQVFDARTDATVGPCLSDSGPVRLDACLTLDFGPPPDTGADDASDPGTDGPPRPDVCLSDIGDLDATEDAEVVGAVSPRRREVIRRLVASGALPDDVARRLGVPGKSEES